MNIEKIIKEEIIEFYDIFSDEDQDSDDDKKIKSMFRDFVKKRDPSGYEKRKRDAEQKKQKINKPQT